MELIYVLICVGAVAAAWRSGVHDWVHLACVALVAPALVIGFATCLWRNLGASGTADRVMPFIGVTVVFAVFAVASGVTGWVKFTHQRDKWLHHKTDTSHKRRLDGE